MAFEDVQALTFDVFGTVVDWRSSVAREAAAVGKAKRVVRDWHAFADAWRAQYRPSMDRVRHGDLPWTRLTDLHRMMLEGLLPEFGPAGLTSQEVEHLTRAWERLDPWPDAPEGLARLRPRYIVATLSNGDVGLLTRLSKYVGLSWDCIFSSELARHYKPDPEVYRTAVNLLGLRPEQVMMVAAHSGDLQAARAQGMRTAFVFRPHEHGPNGQMDRGEDLAIDVWAESFTDLADKLGA